MATVSETISTLISNVQNAAAEMVTTVNSYSYNLIQAAGLDSIYRDASGKLVLGDPPKVGQMPSHEFVAPTSLLVMLDQAKQSLSDIGDDIPNLADIINLTNSQAVDVFVSYLDGYRDQITGRAATIQIAQARLFPLAGQVRQNAELATTELSPRLAVPAFAATGFANSLATRLLEQGGVAYSRALAVEKLLNVTVQAKIDALTAERSIMEVQSLLNFCSAAMNGAVAIIRKTIVSPEDVVKLFRQLSQARTQVATGLASNRAAYAGTYLEYVNAVVGYYDLFAELEKVRLAADALPLRMDQSENEILAAQLIGAAAASANSAAAGYSAARVGIVLTDKAFS